MEASILTGLSIMGKGMAGIFVVILILMIGIMCMNRIGTMNHSLHKLSEADGNEKKRNGQSEA